MIEFGGGWFVVKEQVPPLEDDIRWQRLLRTAVACASCGETHRGLFDLAVDRPEPWPGERVPESNSAVVGRTHVLTEDFCIIENRDYLVRCVLQLPIIGAATERLGYGVWSTLSSTNFALYLDTFDSGDQGNVGPWFGWFSNRLKGYPDTMNLKCMVHPRPGRQRPFIELEPTDHPLAVEQQQGITIDRLLELYAINGHDLRAVSTPG
jgi:hypothetical protein